MKSKPIIRKFLVENSATFFLVKNSTVFCGVMDSFFGFKNATILIENSSLA